MGYNTDFSGRVEVVPPLNAGEVAFLKAYARERHVDRVQGPYYVGAGRSPSDRSDIRGYNNPPKGVPGLYCQWVPTEDGRFIEWDEQEKFYDAAKWMEYIIDHFIGGGTGGKMFPPYAHGKVPAVMGGHKVNGIIEAAGQAHDDRWRIVVKDNVVTVQQGHITYDE